MGRLLAALTHPNVAVVHEVGSAAPAAAGPEVHYLVMELVEGETLADRLSRGPLALDDTLRVAQARGRAVGRLGDIWSFGGGARDLPRGRV